MGDIQDFTKFMVICLWVLSIVLVIVVLYRLQKEAQKLAEEKLKNKDLEIEKMVSKSTLDELVELNNKDRKS